MINVEFNPAAEDLPRFTSFREEHEKAADLLRKGGSNGPMLGWLDMERLTDPQLLDEIEHYAEAVRTEADIYIVVGVGGSNQGARACIEALRESYVGPPRSGAPEILWLGNNLSPRSLEQALAYCEGKSVFIDVIAKNFATLEPGVAFRYLRSYMEDRYGRTEAARRMTLTASPGKNRLRAIGAELNCKLFTFPEAVGGRFSVLSAVGLVPIAVAGLDIRRLLAGARRMLEKFYTSAGDDDPVLDYAAARNLLYRQGYGVELFASFELELAYLGRWLVQLFGESEGKQAEGIFPAAASYSEDLHAIGQYVQQGKRQLIETLIVPAPRAGEFPVPANRLAADDGFDYLNGRSLEDINRVAREGTVRAHVDGGVPLIRIETPALSEEALGAVFIFFELSCYLSATILGVDPFDQPGVEEYKRNMFAGLGRDRKA